ncbi:hypothetical protein Sru01_07880 [Sphaerisporangium rufum]|uniref:Uncharacterized protein n=1 Tax=Sphaerisporangium rufum TaxID=1381558 RepID=A0A919UW96_9ACTN|nr:hypothetical protein [Sphaerisporangium rufum]GII75806.1 hypothetical protein Sru01_07880 [Sphaerisporangium rufum]
MLSPRLAKSIGVSLIGAVLAIGLATPAAAAASTAYNVKEIYLELPRAENPEVCWNKEIKLASGTYKWGLVEYDVPQTTHPTVDVYLAAGTYKWTYCIDPVVSYNKLTSTLQSTSKPNLPVAKIEAYHAYFEGWWTIGSYLDPAF